MIFPETNFHFSETNMLWREHSGNEEGPASPPGLEIDSLER